MMSRVGISRICGLARTSTGRAVILPSSRAFDHALPSFTNAKAKFATPESTNARLLARCFATMSEKDLKKRLDEFQELFVEARLCIEDCTDAAETKYFDEEAEAAMEAVQEAVDAFQAIIDDIEDPDEKNRILRGNGLKVEQLKGELELAVKGGHDH